MPTCPHCNEESPRRKKDACPLCGKTVYIVREGRGKKKKTVWVGEETRASELVYFLEEHIRRRPGMGQYFTFGEPGEQSRNMQIGIAKTLLKKCGYSQELAVAVVDAYCASDRRLYPPKSMQGVIGKQFQMALAIAKHNVEQKQSRLEAEQRKLEDAVRSRIGALKLYATV